MADRVALATVHGDQRATCYDESLLALLAYDGVHDGFLVHDEGRMAVRVGTDGLVAARNVIAARAVTSEVDWLFWVDSDMGFAPDSLARLMAVADPQTRPVVGGLCFVSRQFAHDGLSGYRTRPMPTLYAWHEGDDGVPRFAPVPLYPVNGVMKVPATGSAFLLVHRSVYERIAEQHGPTWYDRMAGTDGHLLGEDISFCVRAGAVDVPIHVHTGVRTCHMKTQWVSEADHWRNFNPPPAADETAVLVPVLRRPGNAEPFMRSLRASTGLATVYAIADDDDPQTAEAWAEAGAEVIVSNVRTFARKANLGYAKTRQPWVFLTGDDVKFHPAWLDHAQHVGEVLEAGVVGTNDLGNPRVTSGEHATHLLIRRSYVRDMGASWDGPDVLAHEGYGHWYVDDEIVTAAKQRGVWQMALGAVVEHLHPLWGKAVEDDVYRLGRATAEVDAALFRERLAVNT